MKIDLQKMYDNGIEYLYMGGEIVNDQFFREKDVMNDDYSCPSIIGGFDIITHKTDENNFHYVTGEGERCGLILTDEEYNAGLVL